MAVFRNKLFSQVAPRGAKPLRPSRAAGEKQRLDVMRLRSSLENLRVEQEQVSN